RCRVVSSDMMPAMPHMPACLFLEGPGSVQESHSPVPLTGPPQPFQEGHLGRVTELLLGAGDVERAVLAVPVHAAWEDGGRDPERPTHRLHDVPGDDQRSDGETADLDRHAECFDDHPNRKSTHLNSWHEKISNVY